MYKKGNQGWRKHLDFIILDVIILYGSYVLAIWARQARIRPSYRYIYNNGALIIMAASFLCSLFLENHKNILKRGLWREIKSVAVQVIVTFSALLVYLFAVQRGGVFSRLIAFFYAGIGFALDLAARCIWKSVLIRLRKRNNAGRHVLLVTRKERAASTIKKINAKSIGELRIAGVVIEDDDSQVGSEIEGVPVAASFTELVKYIQTEWVDEVMVDLPWEPRTDALLSDLAVMGITSHHVIDTDSERQTVRTVEKVGGFMALTETIRIPAQAQVIAKRALDIAGGLVGVAVTAVLALVIGPLIFAADPGPIFFAQKRVGKNGRVFKMYKFRTMYKDAEARKKELMDRNEAGGMMFKMENDPRIIGSGDDGAKHGIGHFLRRTSLDEFPQFLNVLLGSMSLCGTRPPTVDEWERYEKHHRARLSMKPGMTGLWQVSGRSDIKDFEEVIKLDMKYINTWTIGKDFRIILKTLVIMLTGRGAE